MLALSAATRAVVAEPQLRPAVDALQREACRLTGAADATVIALDPARGSLWTRDGARQLRVARALRTGVLGVNTNSSVFVQMPFGGYKQSGVGKELGMHALEHNTELKSVFISTE